MTSQNLLTFNTKSKITNAQKFKYRRLQQGELLFILIVNTYFIDYNLANMILPDIEKTNSNIDSEEESQGKETISFLFFVFFTCVEIFSDSSFCAFEQT